MKSKKKLHTFFYTIGILVMVMGLYAFKSGNTVTESYYMPQTPWKNLKVLPQDISKDSLESLMKNYSLALNVKCSHCHAPSETEPGKLDFASDAKFEKNVTRGMITMTNDLNEKYFLPYFPDPKPAQADVVNCVMCHRGVANPERYLSQMGSMFKTYDAERDNRKEKILEAMKKQQ